MASAKLMIPKRSAPYYVLTANVTVHGKRVRRYGRFDFDPTVLKTHRQRENAAIEAALVFERAEQQKADDEKDGKNTPFRDAARAYIDSKKSMLDPSVRLEGDYEQHKNKANTTAGKETMLRRICEISPAFAEMPISKVNKRECEKFLDLLGEADVRSVKGYAVLKPNAKQYKKLSCPQIAAQCSIQTKSVERVFRGERTTLKTAQEIAAALKCKPEKLFHIELDHRPIARKTIKEYAIFLRLVMQYAVAAKIADLIEQGRLMVPIKATPVQQQMEQLTLTPEDSETPTAQNVSTAIICWRTHSTCGPPKFTIQSMTKTARSSINSMVLPPKNRQPDCCRRAI